MYFVADNEQWKIQERGAQECSEQRESKDFMAMFCNPHVEIILSPLPALIDNDHPALYQSSSWKEYLQKFFIKGLDGKGHVHQLQQS